MKKAVINRSYLESLSFTDLKKIADEYSIDVPENLNRGFLIGEILEAVDEADNSFLMSNSLSDDIEMTLSDDEIVIPESELLPKSYNSTEVKIMLRNPAWAFIYWNISEADQVSLEGAFVSELRLRVSSFSNKDQVKADEYFDIQISKEDNGQYVLLPAGKKFFRVDLLFNLDGIVDILASSNVLEMPDCPERLKMLKPGVSEMDENLSPVMRLSGMQGLLVSFYENHRESFS